MGKVNPPTITKSAGGSDFTCITFYPDLSRFIMDCLGEDIVPLLLSVIVNALIVNPAFDSQTKENLTTKEKMFGSTCTISEKMMKAIEKSDIIDNTLNFSKFKQAAVWMKKSGTKRNKLAGIPKLDDANCAGASKSNQCTLILTEGDSAKALAISGLGVVGHDYYGVFPLKGKL